VLGERSEPRGISGTPHNGYQTVPIGELRCEVGGLSLLFRADGRLCALGLEYVSEIMRPVAVVPVAGAPPFVRGVCVIRGLPTPVVDTAALVGADGRGVTRFVVVKGGRYPAVLAVDEVLGVREISAESSHELSPLLGTADAELIVALGAISDEPVLFLSSARIVPDSVWAALDAERTS
jgi:purine-binding chemotaxis protein CheW